jgi:KUP system potassium uptake protein
LKVAPQRTIVFLTDDPCGVPFVNDDLWLAPLIAEDQLVLLTIAPVSIPYVDDDARVVIERLTNRFVRVRAAFGYMERPALAPILRECEAARLDIDKETTAFVYANFVIVPIARGLPRWQRGLFSWLQRNERKLVVELEIPARRRVELSVEATV